jgi:hypothetical protein
VLPTRYHKPRYRVLLCTVLPPVLDGSLPHEEEAAVRDELARDRAGREEKACRHHRREASMGEKWDNSTPRVMQETVKGLEEMEKICKILNKMLMNAV